MQIERLVMAALLVTVISLPAPEAAYAQQVNPQDFGIVEAPTAGSAAVPMNQVPPAIRHSAQVAAKQYEGQANWTA